ncbi:MAG: bifunctional 23S rRNA (guanine(2069)-N(7))-methyltransferase RlmK/23S rRNA (guanine(2445)-N(2))-methyltransferase RlmL [Gammaproteobacteria bacterium]|nr:MAG: bifunctional 23S rRNA (guanine(2069)-N(7))-methyltransferase RlmK/23S rRNA (guanine(2445)-N(2))-methyltransferase RlmL [Gammaproteobacteria bacterium]
MLSEYFVSCPRGLEGVLYEELKEMDILNIRETVAGVGFRDSLESAYKVCLWSRLANRVLMPLHTFAVANADDLYQGAYDIDWLQHFDVEATIVVDFVGTGPGIDHTQFGAQRVKDGVVDRFRDHTGQRPDVQTRAPDIRINARFAHDKVTLSLDLSGDSLHRRGYRKVNTGAPLKENLAAALLIRAGWPDEQYAALVDPMCGSGTLLIEAAMMAADIAPGLSRERYGFTCWSGHQVDLWEALRDEARHRRERGLAKRLPVIRGYDNDGKTVRAADTNISAAGLSQYIGVTRQALEELHNPLPESGARGLLITNPPYGARMGDEGELRPLYASLGAVLKKQFAGWRAAVFSANETLCFELGLRSDRQYKLFNGALPARLLLFDVFADQRGISVSTGSSANTPATTSAPKNSEESLSTGATMLANRLRKNLRKLRNWLRTESIECYRLYDADLPEYAVAIDCYGDAVHVQEYAPPASVDQDAAKRRIVEVRQAVAAVLKPQPNNLFFKERKQQRGEEQYRRSEQGSGAGVFTVQEYGLRFEVSMAAYLDTGLFLDHRPVRRMLTNICQARRFLNLFCYTASATVCAVAAGASTSLSIDMSNTYLDWAKRNFALNGIDSPQHRFLRADCLAWLAKGGDGVSYDVIFLDPPTFSNSKKMTDVLDIQKDHEKLIRQAVTLLTEDGVLIFSTNLRRFKMATGVIDDFATENISAQTIDPDFARRPNIHHCWTIRRGRSLGGKSDAGQ